MVTFEPIGMVRLENGRYYLDIDKRVLPALMTLDEYSHIQMIWWFNLYDSEETRNYLVMDKPYINGPAKVGVLATRGPVRPNPIAVTACRLLNADMLNGILEVDYTDAESGTPILDIKPYHPSSDIVRDVQMPAWCSHWPSSVEESGQFDWSREFNFPE